MTPVLVLGGGLTGLVTAAQLQAGGIEAIVLEKQAEPGGCCRSMSEDGFTFDYTGHLLHCSSERAQQFFSRIGVWSQLGVHERRAAVVINGRTTPYPVQINTHGLDRATRRDCLLGFIHAWAQQDTAEPESFAEWVLQHFGRGLAEHFFFPYNTKLYRTRPEDLSLDWVNRFVPRTSLEEVVDGCLGLYDKQAGYNAVFRYPRLGGIRVLADTIAEQLPQLLLQHEVQRINPAERWVELGTGERLSYDQVVSTLALPDLLDRLTIDLPAPVVEARRRLRWVSVVNLALGVEGPAPCPQHWLYLPDPAVPFYRVGFPSNHGALAPPGCHTVSVECSAMMGHGDPKALAAAAEEALADLGYLVRERIRVRRVAVIDPAYVVYDHHHRAAVSVLQDFLLANGLRSVGRWASWKYSSMEDAVLDGCATADEIAGRECTEQRS